MVGSLGARLRRSAPSDHMMTPLLVILRRSCASTTALIVGVLSNDDVLILIEVCSSAHGLCFAEHVRLCSDELGGLLCGLLTTVVSLEVVAVLVGAPM